MNGVKTLITLHGDLAAFLGLLVRPRSALAAENLFLHKQLTMYQQRKLNPRRTDTPFRIDLVLLSRLFNWRDALVVVQPKTLVRWYRQGFRLFWRWKSRPGRPRIPMELRRLIREMALSNPSRGVERIANELLLKWVSEYRRAQYENIFPNPRPENRATINAGQPLFATMRQLYSLVISMSSLPQRSDYSTYL